MTSMSDISKQKAPEFRAPFLEESFHDKFKSTSLHAPHEAHRLIDAVELDTKFRQRHHP